MMDKGTARNTGQEYAVVLLTSQDLQLFT